METLESTKDPYGEIWYELVAIHLYYDMLRWIVSHDFLGDDEATFIKSPEIY